MKRILLITLLALISASTFSQNPFPKGRNQLNLGVGLSDWGVPIYFGLDHGVGNDFSIGGELSFRDYNERWNDDDYSHSITGISGNANYHFNRILEVNNNWDLYAGLNLGFYIWSSPDAYKGNHNSGLGLGAQIGARYYFSNKVGLNLEFGSGNAFSGGKVGLTIKI
ncbi:MAG: outer membrane beta-barrel protein [Verrucomicrobia bacterium]|nr:outer membrane beta-barrel protein [Prolixibacteraceae bacterium]